MALKNIITRSGSFISRTVSFLSHTTQRNGKEMAEKMIFYFQTNSNNNVAS